ncbi:Bro-N domain-containing protein [Pseudomonas leptonychotis]|uniref:BRO-N domain-containing protein n=1 Tax=Pseudomonas leptonychotis TaxID=2448482 RepID=UPI003864701C
MNTAQIIPFKFDTREVRTLLIDDQPWFVAADVALALEYLTAKDMARNLDDDEKGRQIVPTLGGEQEMLVINESGLYSAILRSRKAEAKRFKKWVTAEVLPAIRKHGSYADTQNKMGTLLGETIGTNGFNMLGSLIKGKVVSLPAVNRAKATAKIWSQTHAAFGVRSGADIPATQLDSARNFIAAYALEGEWLPKEAKVLGVLSLDEYQANGLMCLLHYVDWVNYRWHQGIGEAVKALNPEFYSHTWEFFRGMHQSAKKLERTPEVAALCSTGNARRPHECAGSDMALGRRAG